MNASVIKMAMPHQTPRHDGACMFIAKRETFGTIHLYALRWSGGIMALTGMMRTNNSARLSSQLFPPSSRLVCCHDALDGRFHSTRCTLGIFKKMWAGELTLLGYLRVKVSRFPKMHRWHRDVDLNQPAARYGDLWGALPPPKNTHTTSGSQPCGEHSHL